MSINRCLFSYTSTEYMVLHKISQLYAYNDPRYILSYIYARPCKLTIYYFFMNFMKTHMQFLTRLFGRKRPIDELELAQQGVELDVSPKARIVRVHPDEVLLIRDDEQSVIHIRSEDVSKIMRINNKNEQLQKLIALADACP